MIPVRTLSVGTLVVLSLVAAVVLVPVGILAAESEAAEPEATFTESIEVNLIDLNVVVTTFWGRPLTDLTRDDFLIFEDGEPRQISHFARVVDGVSDGQGAAPDPTRPDAARPTNALDRVIVLVFDSLIDRPYLKRAVTSARDFVAAHSGDGIWWSVIALTARPHSLQSLTRDSASVVATLDSILEDTAAIGRLAFGAPAMPWMPQMEGRWCNLLLTEQTLAFPNVARGLSELFRIYASVPGAKAAVIYQQGMGGGYIEGVAQLLQARRLIEVWQDLGRQATSAGFKVYSMNVLGLNMPLNPAGLHTTPSVSVASFGPTALARDTGGNFFALNDLSEAVKAAVRETGTYYSLAFEAPHGHDGRAHDLEVKVRGRPWLQVRHSKGFFDVDPRTLLVEHLATPADFPKDAGALPLSLEMAPHAVAENRTDFTATVKTVADRLTLLPAEDGPAAAVDLFIAVHDSTGQLVSLKQDTIQVRPPPAAAKGELKWFLKISLPEDPYSVTVALYDPGSGLAGIASTQVAPLG